MKKLVLALALFAAAPAFSADCNISGLPKITGLSYHTARAKLIEAGFMPVKYDPSTTGFAPQSCELISPNPIALGYIETGGLSNQTCSFTWISPAGKNLTLTYSHTRKNPTCTTH